MKTTELLLNLSVSLSQRTQRTFIFSIKHIFQINRDTVIHFYFGANLISVILVQAFFTEIKSLPKFLLRVDGCSCLFKMVWIPLVLPKFSPYRNGEFSLHRKLYATEIKVDYSRSMRRETEREGERWIGREREGERGRERERERERERDRERDGLGEREREGVRERERFPSYSLRSRLAVDVITSCTWS